MTAARQERLGLHDWMTGPADRSGMAAFTHLVRAKDDPEERKARGQQPGRDVTPHKTLQKTSAAEWRRRLLEHMADGQPRTFNRLCVEMTGHTADVCFQLGPDLALWQLVADGLAEHTIDLPVVFRLVRANLAAGIVRTT